MSEGEIRAFREGDTMKLRRADVENLRKELMPGEVVDMGGGAEDLVFEDDLEVEETGMATEQISEMDTLLEEDGVEDVGEVALEEEEVEEVGDEPEAVAGPIRRGGAAVDEPPGEGMLIRSVAILTGLVILLAMPIVIGLSTESPSSMATSLAEMFGGKK